MATDANHTVPNNQPVFQMLSNDAYSDEGTEFYESKNSLESAQEHLINIFEPRMTSKVAMNKPISNNSQDRFQVIQNDEIKSVDKEEKTVEIPPTLDETIDELEAQKRESGKDQPIVNDEEEEEEEDDPKVEESLKNNVSDISENVQSSQSSIAYSDKTNPIAATQNNQSQKSSLNLLDMASSSSLNQKTSLSGSLHENRSTPALLSDGESIKNDKIDDQEDISEDEEDHKEFQIKDFTENNEEFTLFTNSVFSLEMSNKSESIQLSESQQIHKEITMEPAKPKSKMLRFKHVRTFYNRCIQKYYSAKSWVNVSFTRRPKYDQQIEVSIIYKRICTISNQLY
jgi:hypothetical protein